MGSTETSTINRINELLREINEAEKTANLKDPGGRTGESSHPSAKADRGTQKVVSGERARELERDVAEEHPGAGVNNISGDGGSQDSRQLHIGLNPAFAGDDPRVEDSYKSNKEDPGTSHPARAGEEKYAGLSFPSLIKVAFDHINDLIADIAVSAEQTVNAVQNNQVKKASVAAQAGYELAEMVSNQPNQAYLSEFEKDAYVTEIVHRTYQDGIEDADSVGSWLNNYSRNYNDLLRKQAEDAQGGNILSQMAGAGQVAATPEIDPAVTATQDHDLTEAAEDSEEGAVNELVNALIEAGISPEELETAINEQAGGQKAASTMPNAARWLWAAKKASEHLRNGKTKIKEASPGSYRRRQRDEFIEHVREICRR